MSDLTHAQIGRAFVKQYYTTLHENPSELCKLYNASSTLVHGGNDCTGEGDVVYGAEQIAAKLKQLDFHECHTRIIQFDSARTLDNGIVLQVCGEISNRGAPMRRFTQTFVLCPIEARKFYVANDIFRYQDEVFGHSTPSTRKAMIDTAQFARHRTNIQRQETLQRLPVVPTQPQQAWAANSHTNSTFGDCRLQDGPYSESNLADSATVLSSDLKNNWATFSSVSAPFDQSSFTPMTTPVRDSNSAFSADCARQFQLYAALDEHFPLETIEVNCSRSSAAPNNQTGSSNHRSPHQMMNYNSVYSPDAHRNQLSPSNSSPFSPHNMKRCELSPEAVDKIQSPSANSPHSAAGNTSPPVGGEQSPESAPSRSWAAIASCGQSGQPSGAVKISPGTPAAVRSKPAATAAQTLASSVSSAVSVPVYSAQNAVTTTPTRSSRSTTTPSQAATTRQANTGQRYPEDHQVFVGNVSNTVDEKTLRQLMATYGKVLEVRLAERNIADKPKFAFVVFDNAATADKLIADAAQNPVRLHGKRLNIERRNPSNRSSAGNATAAIGARAAGNSGTAGRSSKTSPSSGGNLNRHRAQRATLH